MEGGKGEKVGELVRRDSSLLQAHLPFHMGDHKTLSRKKDGLLPNPSCSTHFFTHSLPPFLPPSLPPSNIPGGNGESGGSTARLSSFCRRGSSCRPRSPTTLCRTAAPARGEGAGSLLSVCLCFAARRRGCARGNGRGAPRESRRRTRGDDGAERRGTPKVGAKKKKERGGN